MMSHQEDVSDEEAIRALLSSAEARSREKEEENDSRHQHGNGGDSGRDRNGRRWDNNFHRDGGRKHHHHHHQVHPHDPSDSNHNRKRSQFSSTNRNSSRSNNNNIMDEKDRSYYGPSDRERKRPRQQQRSRSPGRRESTGPRIVEPEEGDNSKHLNKKEDEDKPKPQFKPNFGLSGALSKDTQLGNVYKGVVLKFQEPPEARAPNTKWRFYVFKKGQKDVLETLHISKQSAYLMGRNADIADIPMLHPSLSSQHAVLQYRALPSAANDGRLSCQPYIMDLESTNGTFLNGVKIDPARYYQLKKGDVLTFGASTREYVLLTEHTTSS